MSKHELNTLPREGELFSSNGGCGADGLLVEETIANGISRSHALKLSHRAWHTSRAVSSLVKLFRFVLFLNAMDSLEAIFSMQRELASMMDLSRYPKTIGGKISALSTAIVHEAVELQRLTDWKWWKRPATFDNEAAKEELIDIWHFVVQASIELGMSPSEIVEEYVKKNKVNRDRQKSGY
jgi:dimeric dUTPase (all-alpha-NTP-PPase superfamily)